MPFSILVCGTAVIILRSNQNSVFAQDASVAEQATENDQGQVYTGLRKIEDGSVISNVHTSKWRIFTDNGRDLFLKACNGFFFLFWLTCFCLRRN